MGGILGVIISLVSGAVGGNIAGGVLKEQSLGPIGNSIAGIVGGGLGGQLLSVLMGTGGTVAGAGAQAAASHTHTPERWIQVPRECAGRCCDPGTPDARTSV